MKRFFTGLLAGALISYLTAPRSGKATLRQLRQLPAPIVSDLKAMGRRTQLQTRQIIQQLKANIGLPSTAFSNSNNLDEFNAYLD